MLVDVNSCDGDLLTQNGVQTYLRLIIRGKGSVCLMGHFSQEIPILYFTNVLWKSVPYCWTAKIKKTIFYVKMTLTTGMDFEAWASRAQCLPNLAGIIDVCNPYFYRYIIIY